ncbi:breast carcinoma-amplified sequence 4 isoform X7 [Pteropus medius]|uniref:breast carcinoma-amplified sequence 4 isoform X7 n=1 Tax=Pteropus vampyrus TaxID=132908 RepID=UPI00196AA0F7|nr:breast carcinoma-amplified sequence 4 isoform X7 [Pteropus giganteus]
MCATGWRCPLGPALGQARAAAAGCAPAPPPPGGPQGMQPAGGGTPRPGSCDGLPRSLCQLDPAALLMLLVDADRPEPVRSGARELALFLTPEPGAEPLGGQGPAPFCFFAVPSGDARIGTLGEGRTRKKKVRTTVHAKEVEETIEGLLLRLEEFCSLTDMIRSDTSQILEENIPLLKAKVTEMRGIYTKVDQLERPRSEVKNVPYGLTSRCQPVPCGGSGGESTPLPFPASRGSPRFLARGPFLRLQSPRPAQHPPVPLVL